MSTYNYLGEEISYKNHPLNGKTIAFIGDSNTQYNTAQFKEYFESLGATFYTNAGAGYTWETTNGTTATDGSAVGQLNKLISEFTLDESTKTLNTNLIVIFMMGTNLKGELGTTSDSDVSTCCGAINYCLNTIAYWGRQIPIGVILPLCGQSNEELREIAEKYAFPIIELEKEVRIFDSSLTSSFASDNYIANGNHFSGNGLAHILRIVGNWIAYRI